MDIYYDDASPLLNLPNELVVRILSFLNPEDLVSVATINDRLQRLTWDKTVVGKVKLFSDIHLEQNVIKSFFDVKARTLNVTELDVCNCLWVTPSVLEHSILQCKHLERLRIVNCNISQAALCRILGKLQHIVELAWSILDGELDVNKFSELSTSKPPTFLNLLDIYLEVVGNSINLAVVCNLLECCLNVQRFHLHVIESLKNVPENSVPIQQNATELLPNLKTFTFSSEKGGGRCPFTYRDPIMLYTEPLVYQVIQSRMSLSSLDRWDMVLKQFNRIPVMYRSISFQIDGPQVCHKSVMFPVEIVSNTRTPTETKELTIMMSDASDLRTVSQWPQRWRNEMLSIIPLKSPEEFLTTDVMLLTSSFESLVSSFQNIVEINLLRFHLPPGFNICKVLAGGLRNLKALAIPACAVYSAKEEKKSDKEFLGFFKRPRTSLAHKQQAQADSPLKHFLDNGIELVELDIRSSSHEGHSFCSSCRSDQSCTNDALSVITLFSSLQKLTLANLQNVQNFSFLMGKQVKSLRLSCVGPSGLCIYASALRQVLDSNNSLTSLMLKHPALDMNSNLLWDSLAKASYLRRICMVSFSNDTLNVNSIATILFKLPYLRVFHIHSRAGNYRVTNERLKDVWDSLGKMNQYRLVVDINTSGQAYKNVFPADQSDLCLMSCSVAYVKPRYRESLDEGDSYFAM